MFRKIFGRSKPGPGTDQPVTKLSGAVEGAILGIVGAQSIPLMPAAAQRAFQLSTDPSAEARDFVEVIESVEALSARVIKIANSVYFDRGKRSNTIEESVIVIGINELRCLLNATTLSDIFPSSHPARAQFWTNDIATALVSRQLARRLMPGKEELAFLAGLMHDLGKLLLLQRAAASYTKVIQRVQEEGIPFSRAEEAEFPFTHGEVGQLIAERWRFSEEITAVIRHHHDALVPGAALTLPSLIHAADLIANSFGFGHMKGFGKFQLFCEEQLHTIWPLLDVPADRARESLADLKKGVELELDLYAGKKA